MITRDKCFVVCKPQHIHTPYTLHAACTHTCTHTHTHTHTHTNTPHPAKHIHKHTAHTLTHTCAPTHKHTNTHTRTYTHTHTHTHHTQPTYTTAHPTQNHHTSPRGGDLPPPPIFCGCVAWGGGTKKSPMPVPQTIAIINTKFVIVSGV